MLPFPNWIDLILQVYLYGNEMSENEDFNDTEAEADLSDEQKVEIAKWFLLNSPAGEIQYVAKGHRFFSFFFVSFQFFKLHF